MAQERASRPMSSFFKFTQIGDSVTGKIRETRTTTNGPMIVVEYPLIRKGRKGPLEKYASVAVGVSTDMAQKLVLPDDVGQFVSITFNDTEPTTKGSAKKIFRVLMLTAAEYNAGAKQADTSHAAEVYNVDKPSTDDGPNDTLAGDDDDEDLPF